MSLFRALSTSRSRRSGYDKLIDETNNNPTTTKTAQFDQHQHDPVELKRAASVPARMLFGSSNRKLSSEVQLQGIPEISNSIPKQQKKKDKVHPVFSLFDGKWRKKKMTANPDFSRYLEYLKEGGVWDKDTNAPVIYYK